MFFLLAQLPLAESQRPLLSYEGDLIGGCRVTILALI
jgi:hypothetical protein